MFFDTLLWYNRGNAHNLHYLLFFTQIETLENLIMTTQLNIIFDLDHTLIDTGAFVRDLFDIFARQDIPPQIIQSTYKTIFDIHGGAYDFGMHTTLIAQSFHDFDIIQAQNDFAQFENVISKYITTQTFQALKSIKRNGAQMMLLTKGSPTIQNLKITKTKLDTIFQDIIICQGNKADAITKLNPPAGTIFLNDNWHETMQIMQISPQLNYILFGRPDFAQFYNLNEITIPRVTSIAQFATELANLTNSK